MNSIQILKILIEKLERYEDYSDDKNNLSIDGFLSYLTPGEDLTVLQSTLIGKSNPEMLNNPHRIENNIERVIAQHLILLNRYVKFYARYAFANNQIKTLEEFSFLMTVLQAEEISKSELIKRNVTEKSSGIEIIKRLIRIGLLYQIHNPKDHRSQLVRLTESGKMELFKLFKNMDMLGKVAAGPLTSFEKEQLAKLLKKLDHFHDENYNNKNLRNLDDFLP